MKLFRAFVVFSGWEDSYCKHGVWATKAEADGQAGAEGLGLRVWNTPAMSKRDLALLIEDNLSDADAQAFEVQS